MNWGLTPSETGIHRRRQHGARHHRRAHRQGRSRRGHHGGRDRCRGAIEARLRVRRGHRGQARRRAPARGHARLRGEAAADARGRDGGRAPPHRSAHPHDRRRHPHRRPLALAGRAGAPGARDAQYARARACRHHGLICALGGGERGSPGGRGSDGRGRRRPLVRERVGPGCRDRGLGKRPGLCLLRHGGARESRARAGAARGRLAFACALDLRGRREARHRARRGSGGAARAGHLEGRHDRARARGAARSSTSSSWPRWCDSGCRPSGRRCSTRSGNSRSRSPTGR